MNNMKNINKQEELMSALWDFVKGLQKSEAIKSGYKLAVKIKNGEIKWIKFKR